MLAKTLLLTIAVVLVTAVTAAAATDGTIPGAAGFPESITVQPGTSTFFVSSFATGAVYRGTQGHQARVFLNSAGAGRTSAAGVKFDGAYLYDANPDADGAQLRRQFGKRWLFARDESDIELLGGKLARKRGTDTL